MHKLQRLNAIKTPDWKKVKNIANMDEIREAQSKYIYIN